MILKSYLHPKKRKPHTSLVSCMVCMTDKKRRDCARNYLINLRRGWVCLDCVAILEKAKSNLKTAERRALEHQAMPPWADTRAIKLIYQQSQNISEQTGIPHHVDHIIPLKHPDVCGLHIAENLQILTATENCSKSNRFNQKISRQKTILKSKGVVKQARLIKKSEDEIPF